MRLINCQIKNVRVHRDINVEFSPGYTLISGANEAGKSTFIEALHRALFLKATASGNPVEKLRSKIFLGHPTIQLKFQAKGETYNLKKLFSGSSGQILLSKESNSEQLLGPHAEELLSSLLGVKEALGSRKATSLLPGRWAHLWVMQGIASNDLLENDKSYYDFESLIFQLEKKGGAAIQQSFNDQLVIKKIDSALSENFNSRGIKKHSPFWRIREELKEAELTLEDSLSKIYQYEKSIDELIDINKSIESLLNIEIPKVKKEKQMILNKGKEFDHLQSEINLNKQKLLPINFEYDALEKVMRNMNKISEEIIKNEVIEKKINKNLIDINANELVLNTSYDSKKEVQLKMKDKYNENQKKLNLLHILVEQNRIEDIISNLKSDIKKSVNELERRRKLEVEISLIPVIKRPDLEYLRDLNQKIRDCKTRINMIKTTVKVIKTKEEIRLNGNQILLEQQIQITEKSAIEIGDDTKLVIIPGGTEEFDNLKNKNKNLEHVYSTKLKSLGFENIKTAELSYENRLSLENKISAIGIITDEEIANKKAQLHQYEQNLININNEILSLDNDANDISSKYLKAYKLNELVELKEQERININNLSFSLKKIEIEIDKLKVNCQILFNKKVEEEANLRSLQTNLLKLRETYRNMLKENGEQEFLLEKASSIKLKSSKLEKYIFSLQNRFCSIADFDVSSELKDIDNKIQSLEAKKDNLIAEKGATNKYCETISISDPYFVFEQAKVKVKLLKSEFQSFKRLTDSHKLLKDLFNKAQADLSMRYTDPLAKSIGNYLMPLMTNFPAIKLNFDQNSGFSGLSIQRGEELYAFDQLSCGMREQLAGALRFSMADVLKADHDDCLPLIFDDAFANCDQEKILTINQMIKLGVKNGMQVILLTCEPQKYIDFADKFVSLD